MTVPYHPYYFGPAGNLTAIPLAESVTPSILSIAAVNTSINGTATVERFGVKRSWKLAYLGLSEAQESILTQALMGSLAGPLYLVDPLVTNTLHPGVATTGSTAFSSALFTTSDTLETVTIEAPDSTNPTNPDHAKQIALFNGAAGNRNVYTPNVAVPGVPYTVSAWIKCTAGTVAFQLWNSTAQLATTTTVGTTWAQYALTATTTDGFLKPVFNVPAGVTAKIAGLQLEVGAVATPWVPGGGSSKVYVSSMDRASTLWPYRDASVTLVEI